MQIIPCERIDEQSRMKRESQLTGWFAGYMAGGQVRPYEVDVAFPRTGTMLRYPCEDDVAFPCEDDVALPL